MQSDKQHQGQIFTIGYGAKSTEDFIAILAQHYIEFVIDVRSSPYSKYRPEFSRESLKLSLAKHQIKYVFMGSQLGGRPDDGTCYDQDGKVDYALLERRPYFISGIERLTKAYVMGYKVCLICSEDKPEECHRSKLIGRVLESHGLSVVHIVSKLRVLSQVDVMNLLQRGQTALFSDPLKSRKSYLR